MYTVYYFTETGDYRKVFQTFNEALELAHILRNDGAIVRIYNPAGYLMGA